MKEKKLKSLENINETYEEFIKKQNLNFEFEIKNEEFQFYGSSPVTDKYYDVLRKNKTFKIDKDIFLDFYKDQKLELELRQKNSEIQIDNLFAKRKEELENYFSKLKFKESIDEKMDLKLNIKTEQSLIKYKLKREKDLEDFFNKKKRKGKRME